MRLELAAALLLASSLPAFGQDLEALARDPKLFLAAAVQHGRWNEPSEPTQIAGPIYFVGSHGLSAWLISTSEGHILLNTGMPESGPMIAASIRKLGMKPEDIRLLLTCHAHIDHVGGHAYIKRLSGARVAIMEGEQSLLRTGGKDDFHYGSVAEFGYEPVSADRVLRDGETLTLGDIAMTAHATAGHSRGGATWTTNIVDGGKLYSVIFPDGSGVNPGYRLVRNPSYPGIADDYRRTLHFLEMQKPDIWLAPHTDVFDLAGKRARAGQQGARAWVDPEGYRSWVADQRAKFEAIVAAESK
jgi:metallo-beta-lactamase class B